MKLGKRLIRAAREGVAIARGELDPASYRVRNKTGIPLRWANSGPEGERNAYGTVVTKEGHPVICTHGGSMWLCESCAKIILEHNPDDVRRAG